MSRARVAACLLLVVSVQAGLAACGRAAQVNEASGTVTDGGQPATTKAKTVSVEEFCDAVEENKEDLTGLDDAFGAVQYLTALRKLQRRAAKDVKLDIDALVRLLSGIDDLPDDEARDRFEQMDANPEFVRAYRSFNRFVEQNCQIDLVRSATTVRKTTTTGDATTTTGKKVSAQEALDGLKTFLNDKYGSTSWISKLAGLKVTLRTGAQVTGDFTVGSEEGSTLTVDEAVAACTAVAEYIDQNFSDGKATITGAGEQPIASRPGKSGPCMPA